MNDFIRYRSIGCSFYGIKQNDIDDILDMANCTWTETQLQSDLRNQVLPVGLLLFDVLDGGVHRVVCKRVEHGHRHITEKECYGSELAQESI